MSFLGLRQSASIEISLDNLTNRKVVEVKTDPQQPCILPIFYNGESISGKVTLSLKKGGKLEYQGIKIELIGHIDFFADRGSRDVFLNKTQDLARPGILSQSSTVYPFAFNNIEMPFESYTGANVQLRYFLQVTVLKRFMDLTKEQDLLVHSFYRPLHPDTNIQMEVGIEDSLHIEFEYNKSSYHLDDVIVGKIYFLLVRVKIKYMEVQILRRESTGIGPINAVTDTESLAKFEIMDGAPVRGECIPFRLFLGAYGLTPTLKDVNRKFSVRYYLNLVLLDEEDRRYYKQHEICLFRLPDKRYEALIAQMAKAAQNRTKSAPVLLPPLSASPSTPHQPASGDADHRHSHASTEDTEINNENHSSAQLDIEKDSGAHDTAKIPGVSKEGASNGEASSPTHFDNHLPQPPPVATTEKEGDEEEESGGLQEPDVFQDLSDEEKAGEEDRERRSFARYQSPRDEVQPTPVATTASPEPAVS